MVMIGEWQYVELDQVDSTNDEIKKYVDRTGYKVVLRTKKQTAGRGRLGRSWISHEGNLFFSMALEFALKDLGQLVIISSLSLLEAIKSISPTANVMLKWPNDVLINEAKVSGILLEKGAGNYLIVGVGVNIESYPMNNEVMYQATSLRAENIVVTGDDLLSLYMEIFTKNLSLRQEKGFAVLRDKWLKNAKNLGQEIVVRQNGKEIKGMFVGIDEDAGLLIDVAGNTQKIWAGDVFFS